MGKLLSTGVIKLVTAQSRTPSPDLLLSARRRWFCAHTSEDDVARAFRSASTANCIHVFRPRFAIILVFTCFRSRRLAPPRLAFRERGCLRDRRAMLITLRLADIIVRLPSSINRCRIHSLCRCRSSGDVRQLVIRRTASQNESVSQRVFRRRGRCSCRSIGHF